MELQRNVAKVSNRQEQRSGAVNATNLTNQALENLDITGHRWHFFHPKLPLKKNYQNLSLLLPQCLSNLPSTPHFITSNLAQALNENSLITS